MPEALIPKKSGTALSVPTTAQLLLGEIAVNTYDGKVYLRGDNGSPFVIEVGAIGAHTHVISDVTGLQAALDAKAGNSHTHTLADITDFNIDAVGTGEVLQRSGALWVNRTLAEAGIAATGHTHAIADVVGLQTALDGKASSTHNHTVDLLSNVTVTGKATGDLIRWSGSAWVNATLAGAGIAAASHTHATADIVSGTFADARVAQSNVTQHASAINHNILTNYVSNEHINHGTVSVLAGDGMSGGGTIVATRTLNVDINGLTADASPSGAADYVMTYDASAGTLKKVLIDNLPFVADLGGLSDTSLVTPASGEFLRFDGTSWVDSAILATDVPNLSAAQITSGVFADGRIPSLDTAKVTTGVFANARISAGSVTQHQAAINHDLLLNFAADEHIGHSTVSILAGDGMSGGGTIAATRTLNVDINGLTNEASPVGGSDYVMFYDASAGALRKTLVGNLSGASTLSAASNETITGDWTFEGTLTSLSTLNLGADTGGTTRTDATRKDTFITGAHYTNAEEDVMFLFGENNSAWNIMRLGGGASAANAANYLEFFTGALKTTLQGTKRLSIDPDGDFDFQGNFVTGIGTMEIVDNGSPGLTMKCEDQFVSGQAFGHLDFWSTDGSGSSDGVKAYIRPVAEDIYGRVRLDFGTATFSEQAVRHWSIHHDGRFLNANAQGLAPVITGNYGTVQTTGVGTGGWAGYNVDGEFALMWNGSRGGLYDDRTGKGWALQYNQYGNEEVVVYYGNNQSMRTHNEGATFGNDVSGTTNPGNVAVIRDISTPYISYHNNVGGRMGYIQHGNSNGFIVNAETGKIDFRTAGAQEMILTTGGTLHVDGNIVAYSTSVSDIRHKEDLRVISDPLEKLRTLSGYHYRWKTDGKWDVGLIAQEVEKVLPHLVTEQNTLSKGQSKTLHYDGIHALLVEAVKALEDRVVQLEEQPHAA